MHITEIQTTLCNFTRQWDNGSSSMLSKPDPKYWTVLLLQRKEPKWAAAFLKGSIHIICLFWQGAERRDRWCRAALCCLLEAFKKKKTLESNENRSNTKLKHWFTALLQTLDEFLLMRRDQIHVDTVYMDLIQITVIHDIFAYINGPI